MNQPANTALPAAANSQYMDPLGDLDLALQQWALRHGADRLTARAVALASHAVSQGHSCLALDTIPTRLMSIDNQRALPATLENSPLVGRPDDRLPLILDGNRLYLQRYHAYESRLEKRLHALMAAAPQSVDVGRLLPGNGLFHRDPERSDATHWQAVAAFAALRHRFTVISGGPGTGKTYTIVRLLRVLIESALARGETPPVMALAAPTGKAAARMLTSVRKGLADMADDPDFDPAIHDAMPQNARTLHRLLGLTGQGTRPRFDTDNPLPADVVIIDEASMVDLPMMAKLADAIADDARLILLGDRYQLASVESGAVLADICTHADVNRFSVAQNKAAGALLDTSSNTRTKSNKPLSDHVITLQTSRRFNADSAIGQLAAAVNSGDADRAVRLLRSDHDEIHHHEPKGHGPVVLMNRLADHHARLMTQEDPHHALARLTEHGILAAVRNGPTGSATINAAITERLARRHDFNPASRWYHGRPVMITRNDYRIGLYNGDIGITLQDTDGQLRVWFENDNGLRPFLPGALPEHDSAYAMTIHKSQGSEFDHVTLILPDRDNPVLTRELLYTGLTRARRTLNIHATSNILTATIQRRMTRVSGLDLSA